MADFFYVVVVVVVSPRMKNPLNQGASVLESAWLPANGSNVWLPRYQSIPNQLRFCMGLKLKVFVPVGKSMPRGNSEVCQTWVAVSIHVHIPRDGLAKHPQARVNALSRQPLCIINQGDNQTN